jgi:xylan 1,4-beta-xylosidase
MESRRDALKLVLAGTLAAPAIARAASPDVEQPAPPSACAQAERVWARGVEGQRKADLGDGRYLNPILAGDHPDPTILKDGDDYYMTHSSFEAAPGLIVWHSRDLVNWTMVGPALPKPISIVFAPDIVKHDGRYFIYIPFIPADWSDALRGRRNAIYVIYADDIRGPWSDPVDLGIEGYIDPGHVVGEDGKRYLFLSGIARVALSDDGLATTGPIEPAYDGWRYPDDWVTEAYALEGPKLIRRGDWFYIITAVGGTAGPATGHMVIAARSRSINGPWENCPRNPIVRSNNETEAWWSRGHATAIEGPQGDWYFVYHGFENGYRTLGRQTLLEPFEWGADGWPRALGGDLSAPLAMPTGRAGGSHGIAKSDDFQSPDLGAKWAFYSPSSDEAARIRVGNGQLALAGKGTGPANCSPLIQTVGDRAYEVTVSVELDGAVEAGLLLFFNDRLFLGMGINGERMVTYGGGKVSHWPEPAPACSTLHLRIVNDRNIVTFYYSADGVDWTRHGVRSEVSGYNCNTVADLLSLRPALFATGEGTARFRDFEYRALASG